MSRQYQITMTEYGVNMGDHAETVTRPIAHRPDETVEDLVQRAMGQPGKWESRYMSNRYLTIRAVDDEEGDQCEHRRLGGLATKERSSLPADDMLWFYDDWADDAARPVTTTPPASSGGRHEPPRSEAVLRRRVGDALPR